MRPVTLALHAAALTLACAHSCWGAGLPAKCAGVTDIVVGVSMGKSMIEKGAAEGLLAAIREASKLTTLSIRPVQYNHTTEVTTTGISSTEPSLLQFLGGYGVPFVGSLSPTESLRVIDNRTASFTRSTGSVVTLPIVVNVRASGSDELNAVLTYLAANWSTLSQVSLIAHNTPYGEWAYEYIDGSLKVLTGSSGVMSASFLGTDTMTDAQVSSAMKTLFTPSAPRAIIVCTTPNTTAQVVEWLAKSSYTGVPLYLVSWVSGTDMYTKLSSTAKELLDSKGFDMYFTQNMPTPTPSSLKGATPLVRKFNSAGTYYKSHSALEGYLVGWFVYEVLQEAAARYSTAPTRGDFVYTVFEDLRTFDVQGVILGPYGDGGTYSGSTQSSDDACNQGVHEVFLTKFEPMNGSQTQVADATIKFSGCNAPQWSSGGTVTLVSSVEVSGSTGGTSSRAGLLGAVNDHNSDGDNTVLLRSLQGSIGAISTDLSGSKVVAVAHPVLAKQSYADTFDDVALISPMPGYWYLRRPFHRRIIHLFPSAYDETVAAFKFFQSLNVTRVAVLMNDNSTYTAQCLEGLAHADKDGIQVTTPAGIVDASEYIRAHSASFDAFFVLGGAVDTASDREIAAVRLLNSEAEVSDEDSDNSSIANVYTLSVSPPLISFASTSDLRTEYATWVSSTQQDDTSFQSFFVGKFLSSVIDVAKGGNSNKSLSSSAIISAVYSRSVFTIGGVQIGPFEDSCSSMAVRVIDKKATPKEDQRLIKEEVLLLHKHHHPNLLMLMGYCETRTDLLVVTEYMEGGTLADYLVREKRHADVYSLVAMAFLDAKGTVKVSDFWFSSKRGAFSSSGSGKSLKRAAWQPPEVIAGTFLTPATDVYAFVFQILRSWPATFSTLGAFEVPQDLIPSVGSGNVPGLFSQHSSNSGTKQQQDDSSDEMAASMVSIMHVNLDSVALQEPQTEGLEMHDLAQAKAQGSTGTRGSAPAQRVKDGGEVV
eukprot:m51a1_g8823 putative extracellular ligandbinding (986) ;mRNA; f:353086-357417